LVTSASQHWRGLLWRGSGPRAGDLYRRLLALIFVIAWLSLGTQVRLLIGARGLLPLRDFVEAARDQGQLTFFGDFPTIFWWTQGDAALIAGVGVGVLLALGALLGRWPRRCFGLSTALYLSYAVAGRTFLSFQWDNLLLECGLLASFLPAARSAPLTHFLLRLVLFKLYFESGIAKWQSPLHDWQDGSAMAIYYQTAPLPTALAWRAHNLPLGWHHFESWAVLAIELVLPFAIFGTRPLRLLAAALFTLFQLSNIATANYGFFCYLALALQVFLLDDHDVERAGARFARVATWVTRPVAPTIASARERFARLAPRRSGPAASTPIAPAIGGVAPGGLAGAAAWVGVALFVVLSLVEALFHFTEPGPGLARLAPILRAAQTYRLVNTYHLFAAITRERIEAQFETSSDGGQSWTAHDLWHKPGDPARAPDLVAPHQPRVDFQLWFYGLNYQHREPSYVATLVGRLCDDAAAVAALFRAPLPRKPDAVRLGYWRYRFTTPAERHATGDWWRRESVGTTRAIPCHR
jgi:lipase maturation factor 1